MLVNFNHDKKSYTVGTAQPVVAMTKSTRSLSNKEWKRTFNKDIIANRKAKK